MTGYEEYFYVLDFLPEGKSVMRTREVLAQGMGSSFFTLLEVVAKEGVTLMSYQKVYIGKDERKEISHIKRRITYGDLTTSSKAELPAVVKKIVLEREKDFVHFFNVCSPISMRLHQLELLPGIGKKHLEHILDQRQKKPFESFEDLRSRVPLLTDPIALVTQKVQEELQGNVKHYLFVKPYIQP
ncbi:DUF655 domain-containing protein [Candidatus Micrarchaeota archaeon CG08_land_8_20_14_0_20_49_17]|nr:MAG: hypothetical protein AUJ13_03945 [Candidatus Micrarchaeota archaeon CG1_02_49_24]PIU09398.1 MAG: DUF655 domain-containing protein [Candidatus Micrarchaeota archaeon CG08_land_8_20_14_0_20_49_17]PIZ97138.1 MAG: DUF655 domain-containing protein [Candidatus Micrarchaeota archaeon CG_4_10_14_0_2_um_filter_49_7]HII54097.1 DUF655 domain-containing protein [Candidatus Micrarchaeota archaeon]